MASKIGIYYLIALEARLGCEGVSRTMLPLKAQGRPCSMPLPQHWWCVGHLWFLDFCCIVLASAFMIT